MKRGGTNNPGVLSYAQVKSLRVGQPLKELVHEFGAPANKLEKEGQVVAVAYRAENALGKEGELRIALDEDLRVLKWTLAARTKKK